MIVSDNEPRRPEQKQRNAKQGWTGLHSWIFLAIVAAGLAVIGMQNRYFYLSPLGLGKAYRIDKLFGGIQEFEPVKGSWIKADIPTGPPGPPPQAMSMMPPPPQALQMDKPGSMMPPPGAAPPSVAGNVPGVSAPPSQAMQVKPPETKSNVKEPPTSAIAEQEIPEKPKPAATPPKPPKPVEISEADRFKMFEAKFPGFGKQEFQLASDDLYPNWKKNVVKNGTWAQFLDTYADFVQWWKDSGSPAESGFKLWQDFLASKGH